MIVAIDPVQLAKPPGGQWRPHEFYAGVRGLVEVAKPKHIAARGGCWFETAAVRVHLGVEREFQPARKAHPAFRVRDLASLLARSREHGADACDEQQGERDHCGYVADPFGNRIELIEPR